MGPYLLVFADDGRETHDDGGQCTLHVLVGVVGEQGHTRHDGGQDGVCPVVLTKILRELWRTGEIFIPILVLQLNIHMPK